MSEASEKMDQDVRLHFDGNTVTIELEKVSLFERYKG